MLHPRGSELGELRRSVYKLPEALEFSLIKTTRAHATPYAKRVVSSEPASRAPRDRQATLCSPNTHTVVRKPPANHASGSTVARRKAKIQMAWNTKDAAMPLAKLPLSVFSIREHGSKEHSISGVPFRRDSEKSKASR